MKIKTFISVMSCLLYVFFSPTALGKTPKDWGRLTMEGSIIDAACAIEMGSREQTIEMVTVPIKNILRNGQGVAKSFVIRLINCTFRRVSPELSSMHTFRITFDGLQDGSLIGVIGQAKGVGLQIKDDRGNIALPGVPLPPAQLPTDEKLLHYTINLVPNRQQIQAGEYRSTVRFKMDYY